MKLDQSMAEFLKDYKEIFTKESLRFFNGQRCIRFFDVVKKNCNKTASELVLILMCAIRYITKDISIFKKSRSIEELETILEQHWDTIVELSINRKVQFNLPERALPIIDVLNEFQDRQNRKFAFIELGASFGMIGRCLIHFDRIISEPNLFLVNNQTIPQKNFLIENYMGIDLSPPEVDWFLACLDDLDDYNRIKRILHLGDPSNFLGVKKENALNLNSMAQGNFFNFNNTRPVILTSFMMYQLNRELRKKMEEEIHQFTTRYNGLWINQDVNIQEEESKPKFYLEFNQKVFYEFVDDKCRTWKTV